MTDEAFPDEDFSLAPGVTYRVRVIETQPTTVFEVLSGDLDGALMETNGSDHLYPAEFLFTWWECAGKGRMAVESVKD